MVSGSLCRGTHQWLAQQAPDPHNVHFGAICAATDPVAVVALLKSLGASTGLTMIITGESLLNDGTAIVLFVIFCDLATGVINTPPAVAGFVARMALGGPAVGFACGACLVVALPPRAPLYPHKC